MSDLISGLISGIVFFIGTCFTAGFLISVYNRYKKDLKSIRLYTITFFVCLGASFFFTGASLIVLSLDFNVELGLDLLKVGSVLSASTITSVLLMLSVLIPKFKKYAIIIGLIVTAASIYAFAAEDLVYIIDDVEFTRLQLMTVGATFISLQVTGIAMIVSGHKIKKRNYVALGIGLLTGSASLFLASVIEGLIPSFTLRVLTVTGAGIIYYSDRIK